MFNPKDLARRQIELDRAATERVPHLFDRKKARLLLSPHAFLRGSAPLFYEMLASSTDLAAGPAGEGWLVGDMHLENVGAYRTDQTGSDEGRVAFGLNDFDDATVGPWRLDVLRLATSVLLAGRTFKTTAPESIKQCDTMLAAYAQAAWGEGKAPSMPAPIEELVKKSGERSAKKLLDDRAPVVNGKRTFARGERYLDLTPNLVPEIDRILKAYVAALDKQAPKGAADWTVVDAAFRVAGTGSLGTKRVAILVRGKKEDDERIFDLKEARPSACGGFVASTNASSSAPPVFAHEAERVVTAARRMAAEPPRLLAAVLVDNLSFVGRKLFPQEDKLAFEGFHGGAKLDSVVGYIGHILGSAHARSVVNRPAVRWSAADLAGIVDRAVEIAGLFEAIYLAYARIV